MIELHFVIGSDKPTQIDVGKYVGDCAGIIKECLRVSGLHKTVYCNDPRYLYGFIYLHQKKILDLRIHGPNGRIHISIDGELITDLPDNWDSTTFNFLFHGEEDLQKPVA